MAEGVHFYCPHCWAEVGEIATRCPACSADLQDRLGYREALEHALRCPEALTARRAAYLLGKLGDADAVPALVAALDYGDPYVAGEAVASLAQLGGTRAMEAIQQAQTHPFVTVRRAAAAILRSST